VKTVRPFRPSQDQGGFCLRSIHGRRPGTISPDPAIHRPSGDQARAATESLAARSRRLRATRRSSGGLSAIVTGTIARRLAQQRFAVISVSPRSALNRQSLPLLRVGSTNAAK